jgi:hypothetical protein
LSQDTPPEVRDLADTCVRNVERSLTIRLDYRAETLSVLDHWLNHERVANAGRADVMRLVGAAAGAYFGELVRRRHGAWWRLSGPSPAEWRIELEPVYLAFQPVQLVLDALLRESADGLDERYELDADDEVEVRRRLALLAPVSEDEFYALTTRLDVLDIAVEVIRARRTTAGDECDLLLQPSDYDP